MSRLNARLLDRLRDRARRDVEAGLEFGGVEGCAIAVAHRGEIVWEEGFGAARDDTPMMLFSVSKTVLEAVLWRLFSDGLDPDTPVVEIIPEFMDGTQPGITIAMVESHLGGFAHQRIDEVDAPNRRARIDAFRTWEADRRPGEYEYHPLSGAWVLAEVIERVAGRDYRDVLRRDVLSPLGLDDVHLISLGASEDSLADVLLHRDHMNGYTPDPGLRARLPYGLDTRAGLAVGVPGVGAVGTASGVALLYQAYLHDAIGLWDSSVVADARSRIRVDGPDPAGRPIRRSLSFVVAGAPSERYGERTFFGPATSDHSFGHQGQGGQVAWADPETGLSFAYLTNTVVFPPGGHFHPRSRELSAFAARLLED